MTYHQFYVSQFRVKLFSLSSSSDELKDYASILQIRLPFCENYPQRVERKKIPFRFQQSSYKKVPISLTQSCCKKPQYGFAEEITFFPLVILRNICDEVCFCVTS